MMIEWVIGAEAGTSFFYVQTECKEEARKKFRAFLVAKGYDPTDARIVEMRRQNLGGVRAESARSVRV